MITGGLPVVDDGACTACGNCVEWCPTGAVDIVKNKAVIVHPDDCTYCTDCETVCPAGAIKCPFLIVMVSRKPGTKPERKN
jgi:NAD-dependent dihydropyrimidine dehydrogenase PreA subunit